MAIFKKPTYPERKKKCRILRMLFLGLAVFNHFGPMSVGCFGCACKCESSTSYQIISALRDACPLRHPFSLQEAKLRRIPAVLPEEGSKLCFVFYEGDSEGSLVLGKPEAILILF